MKEIMTKLTEKPIIGTSRQRKLPMKFEPLKGKAIEVFVDEFGNISCYPDELTIIETWDGEKWVS